MWVLVARGRRVSLLLVRERSRGLLVHVVPRSRPSGPGIDQSCRSGWADAVLPLPAARTYEEGLPPKIGIPRCQSAVGQERTQFVPPPPSIGHGNQYQFQGAAQAPSTS